MSFFDNPKRGSGSGSLPRPRGRTCCRCGYHNSNLVSECRGCSHKLCGDCVYPSVERDVTRRRSRGFQTSYASRTSRGNYYASQASRAGLPEVDYSRSKPSWQGSQDTCSQFEGGNSVWQKHYSLTKPGSSDVPTDRLGSNNNGSFGTESRAYLGSQDSYSGSKADYSALQGKDSGLMNGGSVSTYRHGHSESRSTIPARPAPGRAMVVQDPGVAASRPVAGSNSSDSKGNSSASKDGLSESRTDA